MTDKKIAVILPTYNEARTIAKVIDEIRELPIKCAIVVADSNSTDDTDQIAIAREANLLNCPRGKGRAMRHVLPMVKADYVFMMNSDFTYPAASILPMLDMLKGGRLLPKYDAVYGWRRGIEKGAMSFLHEIGNAQLTTLANMLYGPPWTHDLCSGMWGFTGDTVKFLTEHLISNTFTLEADIFGSLAKARKNMGCVEIDYRKRVGSESKLRLKDGLKIAIFLIARRIK